MFRFTVMLCFLMVFLAAASAGAEWRLELYGGAYFPSNSDLDLDRPTAGDRVTFRSVDWDDRSLDGPLYYGARLARYFGDRGRFGIEAEMVHAKLYMDPDEPVAAAGTLDGQPVGGIVLPSGHIRKFSVSHGLNQVYANLLYRTVLWRGMLFDPRLNPHLVLRFGAGPAVTHTESVIDGESGGEYELGGFCAQAGIGVVLPFWRRFYLPVEYKYSWSRLDGLEIPGGTASLDVGGSHLNLGAGVFF